VALGSWELGTDEERADAASAMTVNAVLGGAAMRKSRGRSTPTDTMWCSRKVNAANRELESGVANGTGNEERAPCCKLAPLPQTRRTRRTPMRKSKI